MADHHSSDRLISCLYVHSHINIAYSFSFNDTATTEIYTLSLHDALPIYPADLLHGRRALGLDEIAVAGPAEELPRRSEEHTSELQSQSNLVCRLLLEKKNTSIEGEQACSRGAISRA